MGECRIDLCGAYVFVPEQLADRLDCHPLRQRDGGGEGVPGAMERDVARDARLLQNDLQAGIAPSVCGQVENPAVFRDRQMTGQNRFRNRKQAHADL